MRKIEAVLFDLDDTLYEEKQFVMSGFNAVSLFLSRKNNIDHNKIFNILKDDFDNGLRKKNFNILLEKLGPKNDVSELIKIYREHFPKISLYPDSKGILEHLKNKFKLGLITDGYPLTQKNKISALNIKNYFQVIVINDISLNESKLKMSPFGKAIKKVNVKTQSIIYVGDNPLKDFNTAKKMGIQTCRVKREHGEYSNVTVDRNDEADYVIQDLLQLSTVINKINRG